MSPRALRWALCVPALVAGCGSHPAPPPRIDSVAPSVVAYGASADLMIRGANFLPKAHADYVTSSKSGVGSAFEATLGTVALDEVTWSDTSTLHAHLAPGLPAGTYDLTVRDPSGRAASLPGALRIEPPVGVPAGLTITSAPQTVTAGSCSGAVEVQLENADGSPISAPAALALTASPSDPRASLFSDETCANALSGLSFAVGASTTRLYFRSSLAGSVELWVSASGLSSAAQVETLIAGPPAAFAWEPVAALEPRNGSFPVTVRAVDGFGNPSPAFSGTATLSVAPSLSLTCTSGCSAALTTTAFTSGVWQGALQVGTSASAVTLRADSGSLSGVSNTFAVVDASSRMPPLAHLTATPPVVRVGQSVTFDASGSTDKQDATSSLTVSWDFDGQQSGPAPWTPWSAFQQATHAYATAGRRQARVAVRDTNGDIGYADVDVLVLDASADLCTVTDGSSLDDGATSCADPNLSLPEAIRLSNSLPGKQTLTFTPGLQVNVAQTFTVTDDVDVIGTPGTSVNGASFTFQSGAALLSGLTLSSSNGTSLGTVNAGAGLELSQVSVQGYGVLWIYGAFTARESTFFACNTECLNVEDGADLQVLGSRFNGTSNANAINVQSCPATGARRDVIGNVFENLDKGVDVKNNCGSGPVRVAHNTFDHLVYGVDFGTTAGSGHVLANNIFAHASTAAFRCNGVTFGERSHQLFFQNALDGCGPDPGDLGGDPQFFNPGADDYRLLLSSPARDSALDLGLDLTPAAPGNFWGLAPDRGGRETW